MANNKAGPSPADATCVIHEASLGPDGVVVKGREITQTQAEALRQRGEDIVVCGASLSANRKLAGEIEKNANGAYKRCGPHPKAGDKALPHYQPDPRGPSGHTFYETQNRKTVKGN
jgi:hypothetical protein